MGGLNVIHNGEQFCRPDLFFGSFQHRYLLTVTYVWTWIISFATIGKLIQSRVLQFPCLRSFLIIFFFVNISLSVLPFNVIVLINIFKLTRETFSGKPSEIVVSVWLTCSMIGEFELLNLQRVMVVNGWIWTALISHLLHEYYTIPNRTHLSTLNDLFVHLRKKPLLRFRLS